MGLVRVAHASLFQLLLSKSGASEKTLFSVLNLSSPGRSLPPNLITLFPVVPWFFRNPGIDSVAFPIFGFPKNQVIRFV